jgi:hypothetical protein
MQMLLLVQLTPHRPVCGQVASIPRITGIHYCLWRTAHSSPVPGATPPSLLLWARPLPLLLATRLMAVLLATAVLSAARLTMRQWPPSRARS